MASDNRYRRERNAARRQEEQQATRQEREEQQALREQQVTRQELDEQRGFRQDQRNNAFRRDNSNRVIDGTTGSIRSNPAFQEDRPQNNPITFRRETSALSNYVEKYVADGNDFVGGWEDFLTHSEPQVLNLLRQKRNSKVKFTIHCKMHKTDGETIESRTVRFTTGDIRIVTNETDLKELYKDIMEELTEKIAMMEDTEGSAWLFDSVENIEIHTADWEPLNGSSYKKLPKEIEDKKAVINMQNQDKECFKWSVARALNPVTKNPARIDSNLKIKAKDLNMEGIENPVILKDISKFEDQNPNHLNNSFLS